MIFRLRTWVLFASALTMVPMILALMFGFHYIQELEQARVEAELRYRLLELVHSIDERLAVAVQALQTLGNSAEAQAGDWGRLHEYARKIVASNPHLAAVTLADGGNQLLFVTSIPYGQQTFNARHNDRVNEVLQSGRPNVSGPFTVPISDHHLVAVSAPVFQGGKVVAVLRMILYADAIDELIKRQHLPSDWLVSIVDRNGTIIARSVAPELYVGKLGSNTLRMAIQRNDGQLYRGLSLEGVATTSLALPIYTNNWFAAVGVPDRVLAQVYQCNMVLLGLAILSISLFGGGMILLVSAFFSRQASALEQVVGNDPDAPLLRPLRISEMLRVHDSYRDARARETVAQARLSKVSLEKDEVEDLYDQAPCGYHSLDPQGIVIRINQTELDWLGRSREKVLGQPFLNFLSDASRDTFRASFPRFLSQGHIENLELDICRLDGSAIAVMVSATLIRGENGRPQMSRSTMFDITERKKLEQQLQALSTTDPLTGLPNRRFFYDVAAKEILRNSRHAAPLSVAMLDVDHFKRVNDEHGHATGDLLLKALAGICRANLREIDVVARVGGEEFAILMPQTGIADAEMVLERLRETLASQRINVDNGACVTFTVSIGAAAWRPEETLIDQALSRADAALYDAKQRGRNQIRVVS